MSVQSTIPAATPLANLSPIEWQALRVGSKPADETREALKPQLGREVDFLVRIAGEVNVLPDQSLAVKKPPEAFDLVALLLLQLTPRGRRRVLIETLAAASDLSRTIYPPEIIEQVTELLAMLTTVSAQTVRGSVTGPIRVHRISSTRFAK